MRYILSLFLILLAFNAHAGAVISGAMVSGASMGAAAPSYIFRETFNGSSYCVGSSGDQNCDNAAGWVVDGVTADWNANTSAVSPPFGSLGLNLTGDSSTRVAATLPSTYTLLYVSAIVRPLARTDTASTLRLTSDSDQDICRFTIYSDGYVGVFSGTTESYYNAGFTAPNTLYVKLKCEKNGDNIEASGWYSSDNANWTVATAGNPAVGTAQWEAGDFTSNIAKVKLSPTGNTTGQYFGDVRVKATDITLPY